MEQEMVNPEDFFYREGDTIEISRELYKQIEKVLEANLREERKEYFNTSFIKINEKGADASKKEIEKGEYMEIPDVMELLEKEAPDQTVYTAKGLSLLALKLSWEQIHFNNIKSGKAVPIATLIEEESQKRMKLQEEPKEEESSLKVVK